MEAVVLFDFAAEAADARSWLLDRIARLALTGDGRLSFVGSDGADTSHPASQTIAVGFRSMAKAQAVLTRWQAEPGFPRGVSARLLQVEPLWSIEPLAVMFP